MFTLIVKNDKRRSYTRLSVLIEILHFTFFLYYTLWSGINMIVICGIVISSTAVVFHFINTKKKEINKNIDLLCFSLLAVVWLILANYLLGGALLILSLFQFWAMQKISLVFHDNRIEFPAFPKRTIKWKELSNVMLKDRVLTLDFRNDNLLQTEITEESYSVDEKQFNEFCRQQLQNMA